jgi:hypothetical protein
MKSSSCTCGTQRKNARECATPPGPLRLLDDIAGSLEANLVDRPRPLAKVAVSRRKAAMS